jgi:hypothetical protein
MKTMTDRVTVVEVGPRDGLGLECGVDLDRLGQTGNWISALLGRDNSNRAGRALAASNTQ